VSLRRQNELLTRENERLEQRYREVSAENDRLKDLLENKVWPTLEKIENFEILLNDQIKTFVAELRTPGEIKR